MKRGALTIAIFVLIGAVVNVAVAWGLAFSIRYDSRMVVGSGLSAPDAPCWGFLRVERFGSVGISAKNVSNIQALVPGWEYQSALVPTWSRLQTRPVAGADRTRRLIEDARGWPSLTLSCAYTSVVAVPGFSVVDGIEVRVHPDPNRATIRSISLPVRPIWSGFLLNTALYAVLAWLCMRGMVYVREMMRKERGRCPACAYPMGESSVCSECGRELPVHRATLPSSHPRPSPSPPP